MREPDALTSGELAEAAGALRDLPRAVALAARHAIVAYVESAIDREALPLPAEAIQQIRAAAHHGVARAMYLDDALTRVLPALARAGIRAIVLKGPALARTIYPDPLFRPYSDIDLAVDTADESAAAACLLACGLTEEPHGAEVARRAHAGHIDEGAAFHRVFVSPDARVAVDLHDDVLQLGLQPAREDDRRRRAIPVPNLPDALMLCPEDQLLQLAVHVHKHGFERLLWLKDIDLLLRVRGAHLRWDQVVADAHAEGVSASIWYTLRLTRDILGTPISDALLRRFAPSAAVRALYGIVWPAPRVMALEGHMRRRAVQFLAADSWRGMVPNLVLMGRRRDRARATCRMILGR